MGTCGGTLGERTRVMTTAALLALGLLAAGCSSDDSATADSTTTSASAPASTTSTSSTTSTTTAPVVDNVLPIVFVHGFAGSAQQYESQAMRFAANGYPLDQIRAFEHDGAGMDITGYANGLAGFIDTTLAETGASQVYLVGHSRGTFVSSTYLGAPDRAAKVAKYVALDGQPCPDTPVPCSALTRDTFPGQGHVEVATSPESFAAQFEFLTGSAPTTTDIEPAATPVTIRGRAVNFPQNTGRAGATLEVWEVDRATGQRVDDEPELTTVLDPDGGFGPLQVSPARRYEYALRSADSTVVHHIYLQNHLADSDFVRLLSSPADGPTRQNTNQAASHVAVIAMRMREWYAEGDARDVLDVSHNGGEAIDVLQPFVGNATIGLHLHDDVASPGVSSLAPLPYFSTQPFQSGIDVAMVAVPTADGVITLRNLPRGDATKPQVFNIPNWPSDQHIVSVLYSDAPQG